MSKRSILSAAEQVAQFLRDDIQRGRWTETMPGVRLLAEELHANRDTVNSALQRLEKEGLLINQGPGLQRKIHRADAGEQRNMRVMIQPYDSNCRNYPYYVEFRNQLQTTGHMVDFAPKTLRDLKMDPKRVMAQAKKLDADAWVFQAAPFAILEPFSGLNLPTFAVAGGASGLNMAGITVDTPHGIKEATRRLVELGHRRIVMMVHEERRIPKLAYQEQDFLRELKRLGIEASRYHLPDWEDSKEGFVDRLDELFRVSPPTALILDTDALFFSAMQYFAQRGLSAPKDVSLVSNISNPVFGWSVPSVAYIDWNMNLINRHLMHWFDKLARGDEQRKLHEIKTRFFEGGTVGPAKS
ncbi:MAG: substrate-binding domain-containing protein [Verrucomicrobiae bacterium]|nr:substrate-binding domain-containing protein [Verrucomicrobiae bacterium]NNJ87357.1 substrate-binding domain-containing protein [Akkermansiaceae bacterium]